MGAIERLKEKTDIITYIHTEMQKNYTLSFGMLMAHRYGYLNKFYFKIQNMEYIDTVRFIKPYRNSVQKCTGLWLGFMTWALSKYCGGKSPQKRYVAIFSLKCIYKRGNIKCMYGYKTTPLYKLFLIVFFSGPATRLLRSSSGKKNIRQPICFNIFFLTFNLSGKIVNYSQ